MSNLTTFQSRAYFAGVFINEDVYRFHIPLDNIDYKNLAAGIMVIVSLLIFVGRVAGSQQAMMVADLLQAIDFSGKLVVIVIRAIAWGIFG